MKIHAGKCTSENGGQATRKTLANPLRNLALSNAVYKRWAIDGFIETTLLVVYSNVFIGRIFCFTRHIVYCLAESRDRSSLNTAINANNAKLEFLTALVQFVSSGRFPITIFHF